MKNQLRLHYAPDNASAIIRLALLEMGIPFETVLVNRSTCEQNSREYLKLNPNGLIPVLETDQGPIFETGAILLWLVDRHGKLGPEVQSPRRGLFLKWLFFLSNTVHPELRQLFYADKYVGDDPPAIEALYQQRQRSLPSHLAKLEALIGDNPFLLGDELTVLDIYLSLMIRWLALYPIGNSGWFDLEQTPRLAALVRRVETRESVLSASKDEGFAPQPFSNPRPPTPSKGSAL